MRSLYVRALFGASAVLFGCICLLWRDRDTWQSLAPILTFPGGAMLGTGLMALLIASGIAVMIPATSRVALFALSCVFAIFALVCVPPIFTAPSAFGSYYGFIEQFSILCGAIAIVAPIVARIGIGISALYYGAGQLVYLAATAALVPAWIPPSAAFWTIATTAAFFAGGIGMISGIFANLAMRLTGLMLVLFGIVVWVPIVLAHSSNHNDWSEFALTLLIGNAALMAADGLKPRQAG